MFNNNNYIQYCELLIN